MFAAVRPCVTAGFALVGAGVIAVAPVEPPPLAVPTVNAAVQLAATPSPLELYPQVFSTALQNTATLAAAYFTDPFPLTRLTVRNQIAALAEAIEALAVGDVGAALSAVGDAIAQPIKTVFGAFEYLDLLLSQPGAPEALFQIIFSPVLGGIAAAGVAIGEVIDAAMSLDLVGLVNAVINIPARIIDGALNGGYGSPFGNFDNLPGLLTPLITEGYLFPGPIALAINIDQDAAEYIDEQAELSEQDAVSQTSDAEANSVAAVSDSTGILDSAEQAGPVEAAVLTEDPAAADDVPVDEAPAEADPADTDPADPDETATDADDDAEVDDAVGDNAQDDGGDDAGDAGGTDGADAE